MMLVPQSANAAAGATNSTQAAIREARTDLVNQDIRASVYPPKAVQGVNGRPSAASAAFNSVRT